MNRMSVLWPNGVRAEPSPEPPSHLRDLNLDYVIDAIASRRPEYDVKPLLWTPLRDPEAVHFRQQVFQDLERPEVREAVDAFTQAMQTTRRYLRQADRSYSPHFRQGWHLEAARVYCDAVTALAQRLAAAPLQSSALQAFRAELQAYVASQPFQTLAAEARSVKQALENITFCVILEYGKFRVKPYEEEKDYTSEIESVFAKFKRPGKTEDYMTTPVHVSGMSHIEAIMVDFVAKMFPEPFAQLAEFCRKHEHFIDEGVAQFEREVQFYLAYLDFVDELRRAGLPFCYPEVSATSKETLVVDGFDIALAHMLSQQGREVVRNGFTLSGPERILVVTGPNQGGKTTFARMVGQIHYLAGLGGPVPGRRARLFLPDRIFTLFPREEDVTTLRSRLEEELFRLRDILQQATSASLVILNEVFASATLQDALFLSDAIMRQLEAKDVLAVWVTFIDELARHSEKTVSMVALVDPHDPAIRTFRVVRRPADGLAYAISLARKYGLTYDQLKEQLR